MQELPTPTAPALGLLTRLQAAWLQRRTPDAGSDDWGMESALPWLQPETSAAQQDA